MQHTTHGFNLDTRQYGLSEPLSRQIQILINLLAEAVREQVGDAVLDFSEQLVVNCKSENWDHASTLLKRLSVGQIRSLLQAYTAFFRLVNQAEQQEITRVNRQRSLEATLDKPRKESIAEAVHQLKEAGLSLDEVVQLINRLVIEPTLTAHPTEARRRSVLFKQQELGNYLQTLNQTSLTEHEYEAVELEVYQQIALLLATDEVRSTGMTVQDEIDHAGFFIRTSIWETVPHIYHDVDMALRRYYGETQDVSAFLRYRSWVGGDRDGNPKVTSMITREAFSRARRDALNLYHAELRQLRRELSISEQQVDTPEALRLSIEADQQEVDLPDNLLEWYAQEPYRLKISTMMYRLEQFLANSEEMAHSDYDSARFVADLVLMRDALKESGLVLVAENQRLMQLIWRAQAFGFHMTALDLRQHSRIHEQTVDELLRLADVHPSYAELPEPERLELLHHELRNPRPLLPPGQQVSEMTARTLESFRIIQDALRREVSSIGSYIISMTHSVSDMLEVLLLAKETGLWRMSNGEVTSNLDVAPLFETIEDLERAEAFMDTLFNDPIYRSHLAARGFFQEMMLGYSDSNKDGGYWMANWALHKAQARLGRVCRRYKVTFQLFHGRGGTTGRGGGRANQAIMALPVESQSGRIRFTEQGEVISFRYAMPAIARRHLEQIVHAMLLATERTTVADSIPASTFLTEAEPVMDTVARRSMDVYRNLIDDPGFWPWYIQVTPIEQISKLKIASRPISRKAASEVDFDGLRAIPWVFAWTQTRFSLPGWYGMGTALQEMLAEGPDRLERLQNMYNEWTFFKTVLNNAQLELTRARLEIARYYARFAEGPILDRIQQEYDKARDAVLRITGQEALLDHSPVIQRTIHFRNPYTDVLNLIQIELLRRWREDADPDRDDLPYALFLSINGIAAAMQSTG